MFRNSVLVVWSILIITLMVGVFAIGMYEERNKEILDVKRTFISATKTYIKDHDLKVNDSLVVTYQDLKREEYVGEVKYQEKECEADVTVLTKYYIFKSYKPNITCK